MAEILDVLPVAPRPNAHADQTVFRALEDQRHEIERLKESLQAVADKAATADRSPFGDLADAIKPLAYVVIVAATVFGAGWAARVWTTPPPVPQTLADTERRVLIMETLTKEDRDRGREVTERLIRRIDALQEAVGRLQMYAPTEPRPTPRQSLPQYDWQEGVEEATVPSPERRAAGIP